MIAILSLGTAPSAFARVYMTQEGALQEAFPAPQQTERHTLYLNAEQVKRVEAEAGIALERNVIPYYVGRLNGRVTGFAYFDTHLVRTLPESILVRLTPDGVIDRIEILSFDEPEDYLPRERWLRQFDGRELNDDLSLKGGIRSVAGATLSSRAITAAARRILAVHRLLVAGPTGKRAPRGEAEGAGKR